MQVQVVNPSVQDINPVRPALSSKAAEQTPVRNNNITDISQAKKKQDEGQQPTAAQLKSAVDNSNNVLKQGHSNLQFSVDQDTHITVVKLVDTETGDVIRQIPSKEMLEIARSINQIQQGLLLKQQA